MQVEVQNCANSPPEGLKTYRAFMME